MSNSISGILPLVKSLEEVCGATDILVAACSLALSDCTFLAAVSQGGGPLNEWKYVYNWQVGCYPSLPLFQQHADKAILELQQLVSVARLVNSTQAAALGADMQRYNQAIELMRTYKGCIPYYLQALGFL